MAHLISLGLALGVLWMLLSGDTQPYLLALGGGSVFLVLLVSHRMDVIDREGHPVHLTPKAVAYWLWLLMEIVKANLEVTRHILRRDMAISPTVFRVRATQHSDLGRVIFANSITLTPGTVSLEVYPDEIEVHAISRDAADGLAEGEMDRRITAWEG
ncbi:MAG TPA: Na+/H+ antiporter subunit E [Gammaproteobacteria bacterium]|nr:Na+/H+ antiporter subunit E [Gammaproteobacteria bacterium]